MPSGGFIFIVLSLLTWSFYPVMLALGLEKSNPLTLVLLIQFFAGVGGILIALPFIKNVKQVLFNILLYAMKRDLNAWIGLFLIGLCSTLFNVFVIYAMTIMEPSAVTIIVQTSPIFTMIFSMALIQKKWASLSIMDFIVAFLSFIGIAFVIIETPDHFGHMSDSLLKQDTLFDSLAIGVLLALLGAVMLALSNALRARVSFKLSTVLEAEQIRGEKTFVATLIGEVVCRVFSFIPAFLLFLTEGAPFHFIGHELIIAAFTGIVVFNIASAALSAALILSNNSSIVLFSFLGPVLSVIWLTLLGLSDITLFYVIGMMIILCSNIGLKLYHMNREKKEKAT